MTGRELTDKDSEHAKCRGKALQAEEAASAQLAGENVCKKNVRKASVAGASGEEIKG